MAWDFSTEPEFEEQLDWMRDFVREEIWPLETIVSELDQAQLDRIYAPLQEQVKERGLWAAHLRPELGGQGFGQVKLGLMHEILGTVAVRAQRVRQCQAPDSGNSRDPRAGRHARAEGALAAPAARRRPEVGLLDDRARHRRLGPDAAADARRARRRRLGHQRPQVVHLERARSPTSSSSWRSPTPTRARTSARRCSSSPVDTPGREHRARRRRRWSTRRTSFGKLGGHAEILYEDVRVPAPTRCSASEGEGFLIAQQRLVPGAHPPLHALARRRRGAPSTCSASARPTARRSGGVLAEKQTVQNWIADSAAQMQAARLMTLHAAWMMDTAGRRPRRARTISLIKFFGARGAARRGRPRAADPRRARLLDRHAARGDVPLRARARASTTAPTRCTASRSRARSCAATSRRPTGCRASTCPTRREAARARSSPTCSRR